MTTLATITVKNQLTIPQEMIEMLGLDEIRKALISIKDKVLVVKPLVSQVDSLAGSLAYLAKTANSKKIRLETKEKIAARIAREGI